MKGSKIKDIPTEKEIVEEAMYYTSEGKVGFPSAGFKKGIEDVAKDKQINIGFTGKAARGAIRFLEAIIPIKYKKMVVNKTWARIKDTPKLSVRPEFKDWSCKLQISYNPKVMSADSLLNLLNWAGSYCGLGDWRPQRGGTYGQYRVKINKKK